jgi:Family of unknown function (DUF5990)/Domain of unknown function (DUF5655)
MPELPDRPDLDQLRRQARDLQRRAAAGDADALHQVRSVANSLTLSAAQLAVARDHGFANWPRLKAEVERRRAAVNDAERAGAGAAPPPLADSWRHLPADQADLVRAQYADRPGLRPILEAVVAAAAGFGPATVEARSTVVSLVSPRRVFAVVKATTKSRVDLGLRLEGVRPAGRLQVARNVGSGTISVRIALTSPDDIDEEVTGWLRRAYEENTAPPAPRPAARRPAAEVGSLTVVIEGYELPGRTCHPDDGGPHGCVYVALCGRSKDREALDIPGRPVQAIEPVPGDAPSARWEAPVTVRRGDTGYDFTGPYVRGDRTDRNIGLAWGDVLDDGTLRLFRGAKLRLADVDPALIEDALRPGRRLIARVRLTDERGNPICARLRPPYIEWLAR